MRINGNGSGGAHIGMFGRPTIHMNKEDDGSGGGDDDEMDPKLVQTFNKLFHKASAEREGRFEKRILSKMETTLGSKFDEIKSLITADMNDDDDDDDAPPTKKEKGSSDGLSPEVRAQLQRSENMAKEAKEKADKWEREAKEAQTRAAKTEERTQLSALLGGAVKPALMDMVVGQLHGRVARDEEDSSKILFKQDDGTFVPLKDGLDAWKKSDAGKEVAPPRAANGSGGSGPSGASRDPKNFDVSDLGSIVGGVMGRQG